MVFRGQGFTDLKHSPAEGPDLFETLMWNRKQNSELSDRDHTCLILAHCFWAGLETGGIVVVRRSTLTASKVFLFFGLGFPISSPPTRDIPRVEVSAKHTAVLTWTKKGNFQYLSIRCVENLLYILDEDWVTERYPIIHKGLYFIFNVGHQWCYLYPTLV